MTYWILYILLDALVNWYWIEKLKKIPNYLTSTIVRGWFFIVIGITVPVTPETFIAWFLFTTCSFWVLFDLILNKLRGKPWNYLGENSFIDSIGKKHPSVYWIAKIVALVMTSIVVIDSI
jgi:hypothetical protein